VLDVGSGRESICGGIPFDAREVSVGRIFGAGRSRETESEKAGIFISRCW
jgi:hypothetical protein